MVEPYVEFKTVEEFDALLREYRETMLRMNVASSMVARAEAGVRDFVNTVRQWRGHHAGTF